jgi:hypothetical protein
MMHRARLILFLLLGLFLLSGSSTGNAAKPVAVPLSKDDQIRAVLFQLMLHPPAGKGVDFPFYKTPDRKWKVFFLDVSRGDPDKALLRSLSSKRLRVKPASAGVFDMHSKTYRSYAIKDRQTGEIGVILSVGKIHWTNRHHVLVNAGYSSGGLYGGAADFTLDQKGGIWSITRVANQMIS